MTCIISDNVGRPSGLIKAASGGGGVWTKIKEITASSDSTISFVDGTSDVVLDSTYPIYVFKFNIHPSADARLQVNFRDGGSSYDATKTSTFWEASHAEDEGRAEVGYVTDYDLAQSTSVQALAYVSNGNEEVSAGTLHLFSPSSTTFVKHYICRVSCHHSMPGSIDTFIAGYCNVTAAIDGVQFSMSSGNIDAGTIKMYGIGDS